MTPDDRATLPDWLTGAGGTPGTESPLLVGLPELDDGARDTAPQTELPARTPLVVPPPRPREKAAPPQWRVTQHEVPHDSADGDDARTYQLEVTNRSAAARLYRVAFALPRNVTNVRLTRKGTRTPSGLEWSLGVIEPGQSVSLGVRVFLEPAAEVFRDAPATIRIAHAPAPHVRLDVSCAVSGPVFMGRPVAVRVAVQNCGTGDAQGVRVAAYGSDPNTALATETVPLIETGETHHLELHLTPDRGPASWRVVTTMGSAPPVHTTIEAVSAEPEVSVSLTLPGSLGTDEEGTGRLVVTNRAPVAVSGTRAALTLPEELIFRGATERGTLSERGDRVEWRVGDLAAGAEWSATVRLVGFTPGRLRLVASVTADGLTEVTADTPLTCQVRRSSGATIAELLAGPVADPAADPLGALDPDAPRARDTRARFLQFRAADLLFALPIGCVREVLRPLPVTPVPGIPEWMCGVANVRGDFVTVVDLAPFLDLGDQGTRRGLVIVQTDGTDPLGLLVDEFIGILPLAADPAPAAPGDRPVRYLAGIALDPAGRVHQLNPDELLAAAESRAAVGP